MTTLTRKPNLIFLTIGGFLAFFLVKLIWWWVGGPQTINPPKETTSTKEASKAASSELGRLWQTFDWNSVMPGKALAEYVGPAWVNWIIWPIVALVVFLIIRVIYRTFFVKAAAGAKSAESNSTWLLILMVILFTAGLSAMVAIHFTKSPHPTEVTVHFPVIKNEIGQTKVTGGVETVYRVNYVAGPPNTGKVWDVCVEVHDPEVFTAPLFFDRSRPDLQVQEFRVSNRTKEVLGKQGGLARLYGFTFNYVLVTRGTKDVCAVYQEKLLAELAK